MFAKLHLLVAVCVTVIVSEAYAQGLCGGISWGKQIGTEYKLPQQHLPQVDVNVLIPNPCGFRQPNGVVVKVCDFDSMPILSFKSKFLLQVHRTGNHGNLGLATVDIYVYCPAATTETV